MPTRKSITSEDVRFEIQKSNKRFILSCLLQIKATLHLAHVTEADAGVYTCRVSNSRTADVARAVLRVSGVVPSFDGASWLSLPTLKDAFRKFDIEVSLKPTGELFTNRPLIPHTNIN